MPNQSRSSRSTRRTDSSTHQDEQSAASRAAHHEHAALALDSADTLAGDARLGGRGNGPVRAQVLQQLQRTRGNRAVARMLQPAAGAVEVQRAPAATAEPAALGQNDAIKTGAAIADVLQTGELRMGDVPAALQPAVRDLWMATRGVRDNQKIPGADRLKLFEDALAALQPALAALGHDSAQRAWLAGQVTPYVARWRENLNLVKAEERVANANLGPDNEVHEIPAEGGDAHAEGAALHAGIPTLVKTITMLNEQAIRFGHDTIHHGIHGMEHAAEHGKGSTGSPLGRLVELQHMLLMADAWLTLSDKEFQHELNHIHGVFNGVATYAELVKAVTELTGSTVGLTASFSAQLARSMGDAAWAAQSTALAQSTGLVLGNVLAGIEIVHGVAVLLDSHASDDKKLEAGRDVAAGTAWFVGSRVGGAAVGGAASSAILITYMELELMADLYGKAMTGIMAGWMSRAYETMGEAAQSIGTDAKELAKAGILLAGEQDPAQQRALGQVQQDNATRLGRSIDRFLADCQPVGYGVGVAYKPGAFKTLRREFAGLVGQQGAHTPETVAPLAAEVLKKIGWCMEHSQDLLREESGLPPAAKEGEEGGEHAGGEGGEH